MTSFEIFFSVSGAALAITIGVAGYFAQKWISSVDSQLRDHSKELRGIAQQAAKIKELHYEGNATIRATIKAEMSKIDLPTYKLNALQEDVTLLKEVTQEKLLPQMSVQAERLGRVIILEDLLGKQEKKLSTLFEVLQRLVKKQQDLK
jgi:hypothetical protein